jgi:RNA polymerase sigma-70 factor (ECF subfamily)
MDELSSLAVQARRGDPPVMAAFIRATQRDVYSLCAYLVDEDTAGDLAQETYLRLFRALPEFRTESSSRTWVLSITRRVCMDELRRRARRARRSRRGLWGGLRRGPTVVPELSTEFSSERSEPLGDDDQAEMRELLRQLPEDRRTAFVLTQIVELSYAEAADICQCPPDTVGSRLARARRDLIRALEPDERTRPVIESQDEP